MRFDRAVLAVLRAEHDTLHAAAASAFIISSRPDFARVIGKETPIPDDQAHGHFLIRHMSLLLLLTGMLRHWRR